MSKAEAPIRVLQMIGGLNIGGSQTMILNLYKAVDRSKVQFDFVLDRSEASFWELVPVVRELGARIYTVPTFKGTNVLEVRKAWNALFKECVEHRVFHSHVRSYASLYLPIARKHGLKTIVHSHSTSNGGKKIAALAKAALQYPLRFQADYFFGCSEEAGKWLFGEKTLKNGRYYMVANSIATARYRFNPEARSAYRKELGINDDAFVCLHVGRLCEPKNHAFLLDVFGELQKKNPNSILLIVGEGDYRERIQTKIAELGLGNKAIMLGARQDVANLMSTADCMLYPSLWEGLPMALVEAQAAGLPCYASDTITRDVNLSPLIKYLPIDKGVAPWLESVGMKAGERVDVSDKLIAAGFDVEHTAKWLTEFYLDLNRQAKRRSS